MFSLTLAADATLRPLERWHVTELAAHVDRAREHLRPWIPFATEVVDEASAELFLDGWAERHFYDRGRIYGIWVDNVLSGGTLIRFLSHRVCEVGVWLDPAAQGRGLIQAAVTPMLAWAFAERGMLRAEWHCSNRNARSRASALRLGFTYEGTMRSNFVADGVRQDSEVYAILADEWLARAEDRGAFTTT